MDKMLHLFYFLFFPVRALKNENPGRRGGGGSLSLEIQAEGDF